MILYIHVQRAFVRFKKSFVHDPVHLSQFRTGLTVAHCFVYVYCHEFCLFFKTHGMCTRARIHATVARWVISFLPFYSPVYARSFHSTPLTADLSILPTWTPSYFTARVCCAKLHTWICWTTRRRTYANGQSHPSASVVQSYCCSECISFLNPVDSFNTVWHKGDTTAHKDNGTIRCTVTEKCYGKRNSLSHLRCAELYMTKHEPRKTDQKRHSHLISSRTARLNRSSALLCM